MSGSTRTRSSTSSRGDLAGDPNGIPDLLDILWRETHGELVEVYRELFGTGPVENAHEDSALAQGKTMSYVCHDQVDFTTSADRRRAAHDLPPFRPRYLSPHYDLGDGFITFTSPAGCRVWDVGRAQPVQHQPVHSSIPTLVLSGQYDTGVPPYVVRHVRFGLTRSHYYKIPASGHLQLASYTNGSACARHIANQFLRDPVGTPDSSCLASVPRLHLVGRSEVGSGASRLSPARFVPLSRGGLPSGWLPRTG